MAKQDYAMMAARIRKPHRIRYEKEVAAPEVVK